ncbi:MAG: RusA family crossover junction endodeoxyribonuclease [Rhizobiales bacterium]|nr:RusA family crossover junction endodeoxyribonuclease [Hyphomicrobiales bacterium]
MTDPVTIIVPGKPHGKGRPRFNGNHAYTPAETRNYERSIGYMARSEMRGKTMIEGPVQLDLRAVFQIPKRWPPMKKAQAITGAIRPLCKPDTDNIVKALLDGMNGIVFRDDMQVVQVNATKVYGCEPFVVATVKSLEATEGQSQGEEV